MIKPIGLTIIMMTGLALASQAQPGTLKRHSIVDEFIIDIYEPPGYSYENKYPIIYFNDGESIFSSAFGLQNILDSLIKSSIINPVVVVGIHASNNRTSKYVPYMDPWITSRWGPYLPNARTYSTKILELIIPYVESRYLSSGKSDRALFGFSFGGLHALWAGLHFNSEYSFIGSLSPSLWVNDYRIIKERIPKMTETTVWLNI